MTDIGEKIIVMGILTKPIYYNDVTSLAWIPGRWLSCSFKAVCPFKRFLIPVAEESRR